jgi:hypothetical protein
MAVRGLCQLLFVPIDRLQQGQLARLTTIRTWQAGVKAEQQL